MQIDDEISAELRIMRRILHFHRAAVFLLLGLSLTVIGGIIAWQDVQNFQAECAARLAVGVIEFPAFPTYLAARLVGCAGLGMLLLSAIAAIVGRIRSRRDQRQFAPIMLR